MKTDSFLKNSFLIFILLFLVYTRGLFELAVGSKILSYVIQLSGVVLFLVLVKIQTRISVKGTNWIMIVCFFLFLAFLTVSSIITGIKYSYPEEVFIFSSILFFLYSMFVFMNVSGPVDEYFTASIVNSLFIIGCVLLAAATFEQIVFNWLYYPGSKFPIQFFPGQRMHLNIIRPASLTGSMLHYPILMPLIGVLVFRFAKEKYKKWISVLFLLSTFVTFSRSGILISIFIAVFYLTDILLSSIRNGRIRKLWEDKKIRKYFLVISGITIITASVLLSVKQSNVFILTIIARIFAFQDTGNSTRYQIWSDVLSVFSRSNIFFGEFAGMATNTVRNILGHSKLSELGGMKHLVTESGFLEVLTATGLLGVCAYYGTLVLSFVRLYFFQKEKLLGYAILAVTVQTFFYQSTEVLPIMFTLSLIALLANRSIPAQNKKGPVRD